jgi:hypothetical protein
LDCGEFQITRIIIMPNDFGHQVGARHRILDRESLVVSTDVPPQASETEEQRQ